MKPDVIVVGAGPAGAATTLLLTERGLSVLLLDRARVPRRKICGEYLSPETVRLLDRLGVLKMLDAAGAVPLAGMTITAPDGTRVVGSYRTVGPWRPYREHALGVSRTTLDAILAERVRSLPVDFREQVRVTDVVLEGRRVVGVRALDREHRPLTFRAPLVIAADGRASVVAHRLGCRQPHRHRRMALVTYASGLEACGGRGEIFVDPPDYSILNPLSPDRVNVSIVVPLEHASPWTGRLETFFEARVKQIPYLARRLAGARREAPVVALGPLAFRVSPPAHDGVLLVGDAAGFYDPFTGEGIFTALQGAELAAPVVARALDTGDTSTRALFDYTRARRAAFRDKERVTRLLQFVIGHRSLANGACRLLSRRPQLLDVLLGVFGDFVPPRALLTGLLARPDA
jgi:flavin-dependent dehydrogenase